MRGERDQDPCDGFRPVEVGRVRQRRTAVVAITTVGNKTHRHHRAVGSFFYHMHCTIIVSFETND